jgi:hypothetical protein
MTSQDAAILIKYIEEADYYINDKRGFYTSAKITLKKIKDWLLSGHEVNYQQTVFLTNLYAEVTGGGKYQMKQIIRGAKNATKADDNR